MAIKDDEKRRWTGKKSSEEVVYVTEEHASLFTAIKQRQRIIGSDMGEALTITVLEVSISGKTTKE